MSPNFQRYILGNIKRGFTDLLTPLQIIEGLQINKMPMFYNNLLSPNRKNLFKK